MTRILSECLLSPNSLLLARLSVSNFTLNDTEKSETDDNDPDPLLSLTKIVGWQPKQRADQILLRKFLMRPEQLRV